MMIFLICMEIYAIVMIEVVAAAPELPWHD